MWLLRNYKRCGLRSTSTVQLQALLKATNPMHFFGASADETQHT